MYNKHTEKGNVITWKQYGHRGYSAFASMGRQIRIGVLAVATLATVAPIASAETRAKGHTEGNPDDRELDEVVVTGTMAPLTQLQSARIVNVLTRTDIEQAGVQSVNDLLKLASGVDVRQRGGFGIQTDISIDGGTYEQVTLLLNGVNLGNPQSNHLAADFPVGVADIERIEILEGAASRVYGGQAFGGAINIVTRHDKQNTLNVGAEGGSYGTFQGDGRLSIISGRVSNHVSGGGGRSDGGTLNDAWKSGKLYYQGDYTHRDFDLNWQFGFSRKEYGANTFYSGSSNDQWEQNERYMMSVGGETKGKLHLAPSVYWTRTYDNYQWHKGTPNNSHQTDVYGAKLAVHFDWWGGKTAMCAEVRNENILSSSLGVLMDSTDWVWAHGADKQYTKRATRTNVSYNLEHNIVLEHWTISAGVLANMNTSVDHRFRFYPGIDVAYRPNRNWKVYATYNKGFRLPSYTDLYYSSPDMSGNDQLKPETNRSASVGAKYSLGWLAVTVRGFYNHGHNMIDYVKPHYGDLARADNFDLDNLGAQADAKVDFKQLAHKDIYLNTLSVSYTYMHQTRDGKYDIFTSLYADDYLRHKVVVSLNHRIYSKLSATWSVRYQQRMGSYQVYDGLKATDQLQDYTPYTMLDLKLQWTDPKYQIYVQGTNLTNHKYCDLGNIPQPGIWIMAGARWNLKF